MLPDPIKKFVDLFTGLPGIGPRQATRLAFYIAKQGKNAITEITKAVSDLNNIEACSICFMSYANGNLRSSSRPGGTKQNISGSTTNVCLICSDQNRRKDIIVVVEKETDLISIERTKKFNGRYLVLGDLKKDGVLESIQKLRLNSLKNWIKKELGGQAPAPEREQNINSERAASDSRLVRGQADEIVLAINPNTYGDLNASLITNELKDSAKKITRLGRGIPTGGEIEFADEDTLGAALDKRS